MKWVMNGGMSATALTWQEIDAYNRCHNYVLSSEEMDIISEMSTNYVSEINNRNPMKKPHFGTYAKKGNNFVNSLIAMAGLKK